MLLFLLDSRIKRVLIEYVDHIRDYLKTRFDLPSELVLYRYNQHKIDPKYKIIIFVQKFHPEMLGPATGDCKVFLLNTEQATVATVGATITAINRHKVYVLDYSLENISILHTKCPKATLIHFPFPFKPTVKKKSAQNTFVGLLSSKYRHDSVGKLPVQNFKGMWGRHRDNLIAKSKILVNVHYNQNYKIFESIRCYHALEMQTLVVSQTSFNNNLVLCKEMIIFADPDKLVEKATHVLQNYQQYYDTIFSNKNITAITKKFEQVYRHSIDQLLNLPCNY